jgi:hypothetical protein
MSWAAEGTVDPPQPTTSHTLNRESKFSVQF